MSFPVRFADKSCKIREFIQFLECESGTSGQELYLKVVNVIRNLGLEMCNFRGRADGAGYMTAKKNGAPCRILKLNDKALYVHYLITDLIL